MIGLIPAAGHATRIQRLPKFLLPTPGGYLLKTLTTRMEMVRPDMILIGTNSENWDLVNRYAPQDSSRVYCVDSATMSETVLAARRYMDTDQMVVFGMPDTYWTDHFVYEYLTSTLLNDQGAIAAAALWNVPPDETYKHGMCQVTASGGGLSVTDIVDKPESTALRRTWGALAWRKTFWRYINAADPHVGFALQRAIAAGETVRAVPFEGLYFNVGSQGDYFALIRAATGEAVNV